MKLLFLFLLALPALATFQVSSASVDALGQTVTVTMNGTYTSGATTSCFTLSGASGPGFNMTPASVVATASSATVTITASGPAYSGDTLTVSLAASPTCAMTGSTGNAATSSATITNGSLYRSAGNSYWSGKVTYQGSPGNVTDGNGWPNSILFNSPNGSFDFTAQLGSGTISIWGIQLNNALTLWVDGVISSRIALGSGANYAQTQFTGLDTATSHTWRIEESSTFSSFRTTGIAALQLPAGTTFGGAPAARKLFGGCGASAWDMTGGGGATANADQTHYGLLSAAYGATFQGASSSGTNLYGTSGALEQICPPDVVPYGGANPLAVLMQPDSNDLYNSISLANYQGAGQAIVTAIMGNAAPPGKLFVIAPNITENTNTTVGNCGTSVIACYLSYTTALAAGVATAANANTVFVHTVSLPYHGPIHGHYSAGDGNGPAALPVNVRP